MHHALPALPTAAQTPGHRALRDAVGPVLFRERAKPARVVDLEGGGVRWVFGGDAKSWGVRSSLERLAGLIRGTLRGGSCGRETARVVVQGTSIEVTGHVLAFGALLRDGLCLCLGGSSLAAKVKAHAYGEGTYREVGVVELTASGEAANVALTDAEAWVRRWMAARFPEVELVRADVRRFGEDTAVMKLRWSVPGARPAAKVA